MSASFRRLLVATGVAGLIGAALVVPNLASASLVDDLVGTVKSTVDTTIAGLSGNSAPSAPAPAGKPARRAGTPPDYVPPAHGDNPHAMGTGVVADLTPEDTTPLPYDPGGGSEDVVVGQSRGEQNDDGSYHGHVTIASLLGTELLEGADTGPGESSTGPTGDVNALLNQLCTASGICLNVLVIGSTTGKNGSANNFSVTDDSINPAGILPGAITANVISSRGNISQDSKCQTSSSSSSVTDANVAGLLTASLLSSDSTSEACNDGSSSVSQNSRTSDVAGIGLLETLSGCTDGDANSNGSILLGVIPIVDVACGADDNSDAGGTQNDAPFGVRESLAAFPLAALLPGLIKATTAASESQAVAPPPATCPDPNNPDCPPIACPDNAGGVTGGVDCLPRFCVRHPNAAACTNPVKFCKAHPNRKRCQNKLGVCARTRAVVPQRCLRGPTGRLREQLPFTGADLARLGLIGLFVMGAGLGLMAVVDRRRRTGHRLQ